MSHNQSRGERTESSQYRKSGRSNQHRNFSGGGSKGSGSGGGATALPPSNNNPSLACNRSFKKHNNVQGGQSRASAPSSPALTPDSSIHPAQRAVQNGAHAQQQSSHGVSDAPLSSSNLKPTAKATDMATPRAPASNVSAASSDSKPPPPPGTPAKVPVETSRSFTPQFGSINPGLMNGMQVPARSSSTPPNLDEQKRDQARHESVRAPADLPSPSIPKQQLPRKDAGTVDQSYVAYSHASVKPKREVPISAAAPVSQQPKTSVHPIPGMPIQMPYHQPQVPVQFGGTNPPMQSQPMSAPSLQMPMPMPLTMGNQPVQQPVLFSGIQPHHMQSQGIMHQDQTLNFTSQMGPQLTPQLGNIPLYMGRQFPQQQPGKFSGPRKTVKITHPETHEELRLYGSPAPRSHPNMLPQSQPISSFPPAHAVNYYPNRSSYNASSLYFQTPSSLPLGSSHPPTSQPPRLYNQVTAKPAPSSHVEKDPASSASSPRTAKVDSRKLSRASQKVQEIVGLPDSTKGDTRESVSTESAVQEKESMPVSVLHHSEENLKYEDEVFEHNSTGSVASSSITKKSVPEGNVAKSAAPRGKKKRRKLLKKFAPTIDLYMAYRGPEEKKETVVSDEHTENSSGNYLELVSSHAPLKDVSNEKAGQSKVVPDDWEDAADISTPKLETSENRNQVVGSGEDFNGTMTKKYSRDFLLKFAKLCTDLPDVKYEDEVSQHNSTGSVASSSITKEKSVPEANVAKSAASRRKKKRRELFKKLDSNVPTAFLYMAYKGPKLCTDHPGGFEFSPDVAEALMVSNVNISRESCCSSGRIIDRQNSASLLDVCGSDMGDDDEWSILAGPLRTGRDMPMDIGYGTNVVGFCPGQVMNDGVLRNPRTQAPMQYPGGILGGPMPSPGSQMGMPRSSPDSKRWQRGTAFQKGLLPCPHTPLQLMHKAEKKYEVGRVTDEEEAKQRQLKAILNKLTPQNFDKLFEQVKQVNIDNAVTLAGFISQIHKALVEPTFWEVYANFCHHLAAELPDLSVGNKKITFKKLLLNKCQEEFERGERGKQEANKVEEEGEVKQREEEREEERLKAQRRMLGNIRLIGELYKKRMVTERIMHGCIKNLLGQYQNPDEENVEALCKLMSTIGKMIDHPRAKKLMDAYFDMMAQLSNNMKLSSRVRFMLKDAIDLRKNKWQQRRKVEGPKMEPQLTACEPFDVYAEPL